MIESPHLLALNLSLKMTPQHIDVIECARRGAKDLGTGDVQELYAALFYTVWHSYYHKDSRCVVVCKNDAERKHLYELISKWLYEDIQQACAYWKGYTLTWHPGQFLKLVLPTHRLARKSRAGIFYLVTDGGAVTDSNEALKDADNILRVWRKR